MANTPTGMKAKDTMKDSKTEKIVQIIGEGLYPQVQLSGITVAERPADGEEDTKLFFNPRDIESFTPEEMAELKLSIRTEGLIEPPLARGFKNDAGELICVELIAGERRLRSLMQIVEENAPCFDEDCVQPEQYLPNAVIVHKGVFGTVIVHDGQNVTVEFEGKEGPYKEQCKYIDVRPTIGGQSLYEFVHCKLLFNCSDERALRLAWAENDHSKPLSIREEINLVRRLEKMGRSQNEIAEILGNNVTWVSQTSNFAEELPANAYQKLLNGEMTRHVAVKLLSFSKEKRQTIFDESVEIERKETEARLADLKKQEVALEDAEDLLKFDAEVAVKKGDDVTAAKTRRKAAAATSKLATVKNRTLEAQKNDGVIQQGHIKKASDLTGIAPKKAKMLDRQQIEDYYVKATTKGLTEDVIDPVTGEVFPSEHIALVRRTAQAILNGCTDFGEVIREMQFDNDLWERPEADDK